VYTAGGVCSNVSTLYTMTSGTGVCTSTVTWTADANYNGATLSQSTTATKINQAVLTLTGVPATAAYQASFTVTPGGGSGSNPLAVSTSGVCSNLGNVVTMTSGTGTCTVQVNRAGDSDYNDGTQVSAATTATKIDPTTTFAGAPASAVYRSSFTVASTTNSSSSPVYTSSGGCSNAGTSYTMTSGTTTCTSTVTWPADSNYNGATKNQYTSAQKANQTITVTTPAPPTAIYNTQFTVAATGGASGNPVVVAAGPAGVCSASGNTITMTSGTGTCTVTYNQAGNANYSAAAQVTDITAAQKASQTINVTQPAPATAMNGNTFNVAATGGTSGNAVVIAGSGACSGGGSNLATITMTSGSGTCAVTFNQAGNAEYSAAPQVTTTVQPQHYTYAGFFAPIDNLPVVNSANAGSAVPVKWTLGLNGVPVSNPASFVGLTSYSLSCGDFLANPSAAVEEYAPGTSGLQYLGNGNWQFNWKTPKTYSGAGHQCRVMVLTLSDGLQYTANFKFK